MSDLHDMKSAIEALRAKMLFDGDGDETVKTLSPWAEQHFLLAIAALETAERHMALADLEQCRAIGGRRG